MYGRIRYFEDTVDNEICGTRDLLLIVIEGVGQVSCLVIESRHGTSESRSDKYQTHLRLQDISRLCFTGWSTLLAQLMSDNSSASSKIKFIIEHVSLQTARPAGAGAVELRGGSGCVPVPVDVGGTSGKFQATDGGMR